MPKVSGVFDQFDNLDKVEPEYINEWLKKRIEPQILETFLGNRILYPQTIPLSNLEMELDLAILREAIKRNITNFYKPISQQKVKNRQKQIVIPQEFTLRFKPLYTLVAAFVDVIDLGPVTQVFVDRQKHLELIGSVLVPPSLPNQNPVLIQIESKQYKFKLNSLVAFPSTKVENQMKIGEMEVRVSGGKLGILVDLRARK